jgi:hypothetical protein
MRKRFWLPVYIVALLVLPAFGQQTDTRKAPAEQRAGKPADQPIDFQKARQLMQRRNRGDKLSAEEAAYLERAMAARRSAEGQPKQPAGGRESIGQKPLTEMTADDKYKGQDGGLYGGGKNTPPESQLKAAQAAIERIQPLNAAGQPAADGQIVLLSISMSNATQEFSRFKRLADNSREKSPRVTVVDGAQGGQAMAEWAPPDAEPWKEAARRIEAASVSPQQVQAAWIKLANKGPRGELEEHGKKLEEDTLAVIQNAKAKYPNLQVAYLGSRIYAGYSTGALNPEPYAYESAFVVRWLIQKQIDGDKQLNYDASRGPVKAPVLLWGPYLWADGTTPRKSDGLVWKREDLAGDGVHPSQAGREKVAQMLLEFFTKDDLARPWFAAER